MARLLFHKTLRMSASTSCTDIPHDRMTSADPEIVSPKLKASESRFLLRTELDRHGTTGEVSSEESNSHQTDADDQFALGNPVAFASIARHGVQSPVCCPGPFLGVCAVE
jgi:hypothetical protein